MIILTFYFSIYYFRNRINKVHALYSLFHRRTLFTRFHTRKADLRVNRGSGLRISSCESFSQFYRCFAQRACINYRKSPGRRGTPRHGSKHVKFLFLRASRGYKHRRIKATWSRGAAPPVKRVVYGNI